MVASHFATIVCALAVSLSHAAGDALPPQASPQASGTLGRFRDSALWAAERARFLRAPISDSGHGHIGSDPRILKLQLQVTKTDENL
jgi:hypothetical protein